MSLTFIGILKLHESARRDPKHLGLEVTKHEELAVKLNELALQYGYGIKFWKPNLSWELEWIDEAIEALGGREITLPFEVTSSPKDGLADLIFARELRDPLDWEKIHFPTFLLEVWQEPLIVEALYARVNGAGTKWKISVKELPPPTSIYRVMDEIVALRASMNVPTKLFYLDKKSIEPKRSNKREA